MKDQILLSDLLCVGRAMGWHLDLVNFWNGLCSIQAKESCEGALVGQGDSP